jgi:hypothetical protein
VTIASPPAIHHPSRPVAYNTGRFSFLLSQILRSPIAVRGPTVARMDDPGRPADLIAWIECPGCGRIDKTAHDFNYPADMAEGLDLFVWLPCEQCGQLAKLHMKRGLKPAH